MPRNTRPRRLPVTDGELAGPPPVADRALEATASREELARPYLLFRGIIRFDETTSEWSEVDRTNRPISPQEIKKLLKRFIQGGIQYTNPVNHVYVGVSRVDFDNWVESLPEEDRNTSQAQYVDVDGVSVPLQPIRWRVDPRRSDIILLSGQHRKEAMKQYYCPLRTRVLALVMTMAATTES